MSYINCKNKNEYLLDGNRYIKTIEICQCEEKNGDEYTIECRIYHRGLHKYIYVPENGYISRYSDSKLWLTVNAKEELSAAIEAFENKLAEAKQSFTPIAVPSLGLEIYYKRNKLPNSYDVAVLLEKVCGGLAISVHTDIRGGGIVSVIENLFKSVRNDDYAKETFEYLFASREDTIDINPIYISAVENDDKKLQHDLKIYYFEEDMRDCPWLQKTIHTRVLPPLSAEYNKSYVVDSDTINISLLQRSRYSIAHRPYFAMMGSTHTKWQLNPHTRTGVDAAKIEAESIPFCEFIELFEENK